MRSLRPSNWINCWIGSGSLSHANQAFSRKFSQGAAHGVSVHGKTDSELGLGGEALADRVSISANVVRQLIFYLLPNKARRHSVVSVAGSRLKMCVCRHTAVKNNAYTLSHYLSIQIDILASKHEGNTSV